MHNESGVVLTRNEISDPIFDSIFQALTFYNNCNPVRYTRSDPTEQGSKTTQSYDVFDCRHPHRLWNAIAACINRVIEGLGTEGKKLRKRYAFSAYHIGERDTLLNPYDIAKMCHCSEKTIRRDIAEVEQLLFDELVKERLVKPEEHKYFKNNRQID